MKGVRFKQLVVIKNLHKSKGRSSVWLCQCDCGSLLEATRKILKEGKRTRCDKCKKEQGHPNKTHGMSRAENSNYGRWRSIKQRTTDPKRPAFKNYGGRGIYMVKEWLSDFSKFDAYIKTLEHYGKTGYELDRKDNNGNYEPGNLRWVTKSINCQNRRERIRNEQGQFI